MSTDNVTHLGAGFYGDVDPNEMLARVAKDTNIEQAFILRVNKDGSLSFHCSTSDTAQINLWVDQWKLQLITGAFEYDE